MKLFLRIRDEHQLHIAAAEYRKNEALARCLAYVICPVRMSEDIVSDLQNKIKNAQTDENKIIYIADLPDVLREKDAHDIGNALDKALESWADGIVIHNIDEIEMVKRCTRPCNDAEGFYIIGDSSLYAYNKEAIAFYKDIFPGMLFMAPDELNDSELEALDHEGDHIYKIYGRIKAMVTAQSMRGNYFAAAGNDNIENGNAGDGNVENRNIENGNIGNRKSSKGIVIASKQDRFICADENFGYSCIYTDEPVNMLTDEAAQPYESVLADLSLESDDEIRAVLMGIANYADGDIDANRQLFGIRVCSGHHYRGID